VEGEAPAGEATLEPAPVAAEEAPSEFDLVLAAELGEPGAETEAASAGEAPAEESAPRKRRSRGGRRRRGAEHETPAEVQPGPEPVYADIADIFEAAERAEAAAREARALARQTAEARPAEARPAEARPAEPEPDPAPELETVGQEPAPPEPLVKPIIIGAADAPVAEKKRGWWRR
jgi:ribonuclease E